VPAQTELDGAFVSSAATGCTLCANGRHSDDTTGAVECQVGYVVVDVKVI
jgi:hypothetical protein